ncbi:GroES-like protein [Polyporus arcularius HHB13444]|uniref:GroES-like protein n=1 Tax=Polyporus arcularius HHB13444 TaxID=1314778 RepID=A0A5C3NZY2_9APHY|nr:GroES-like protein [Polyporus arcularius HHB13444]
MPTQKSLVLPAAQANWEVKLTDVPTPGPQDVLVKIAATALNPLDWKIQAFGLYVQKYPHIAGCEAAGTIEEVGGEVRNLAKGDKILFQGDFANTHATFQQYCLVPADRTSKIPDNISFDQAASVPLGFATVATGLWSHHSDAKSANWPAPWEQEGTTKFAGKPALILGGASSVGQYAIQLAKLSGHSPIITTASSHNAALLKSLGATHVIDRSRAPEDVLREIQKVTGGTPIEYVYDPIATADTQDKLKDGAGKRVVVVFGSVHAPFNRALGLELCSRLTDWLRTGVIVPNRVEVLPKGLAGIPQGLERLKQGTVSGTKLVVRPQETP